MKITGKVDAKTRRQLRSSIGSRVARKSGSKSKGRHKQPKPKAQLADAIIKHLAKYA